MAKAQHITWREIYDLNAALIGKNPDLIQPGMVFTMPNGLPDYTVVPGDYLNKIANRINADIDAQPDEEEIPETEADTEPPAPETEPEAEPAAPAPEVNPHPILNPLHSYATYTYGITLYVLSKDSYNELVNGTSAAWTPTYVLMSSGGWHGDRYKAFQDDFYFDGLSMKTVIGMNANTRGTNAVEIDFTIVEPYGLTLLDRLMEVSNDPTIGNGNYLQQPYLLEVDFFGADELGDVNRMISSLRKRIPIKILTMKIKVGTKGTEYVCKAIPFNHSAFNESTNSAPTNFELKAKTVGDFFDADLTEELSSQVAQKNTERDEIDKLKQEIEAAEMAGNTEQLKELSAKYLQLKKTISAPYSSHSYSGAWNAWNQKVADDKHVSFANRIRFVIDDEIKNSVIVDPTKTAYNRTPMGAVGGGRGGQGGPTAAQAAAANNPTVSSKTPSNNFDPTKMTFNITSGTSIVDTINLVMRNSDYIKSQVVDPLSGKDTFPEDKPVKYFRVIPSITLLDFDPFRNEFAREVTYYIQKYEYFNTKHPNLPKSKPPGPVKQYDYIYTGKNIDIVDLQIDFDTAYHTAVVVNRQNANATNPATGATDTNKADQAAKPAGSGTVVPSTHQPINGDATAQSSGADTPQTVLVANAMKSIYSSSRGDMLNVKLKIVGDPHFIKQDDIYAGPSQGDYDVTEQMINPGTLSMDGRELFCVIQFKTPVDMDDATGLTRENAKYRSSGFSGYYKIITVTSEFKAGQFVQTLDLIRIFDVPDLSETGVTVLEMDDPGAGAANSTAPVTGETKEVEESHETPPEEKDDNEDPSPEEEESRQLEEDLQDADEVDINDKEQTDQDPNDTADAAPANQPITNWDALSFGEAFKEARKIQGGNGGVFLWRGKEYQTTLKGEPLYATSNLTRINF